MQEELTLTAEVEGFQLSPQQDRLWLLQSQEAEAGVVVPYRAVGLVHVTGELQPAALAEAAHRIVMRHEILRTAFRCLPGMTTPLQVVVPDARLEWHGVSLLELAPEARTEAVARLFEAERERRFDPAAGAPLRVTHVELGPRTHNLLLSLPALCADAPTLDALTAELASAYAACIADDADADADEPLQYARLAAWQTELLTEADAAQREFWQRRGAPSLSALTLPGEEKPAATVGFRPAVVSVPLGPETTRRVRAAAEAHGTPVEVFLLSCWQTQLWQLTGLAEFVVGYQTDGRPFEELGGVPGLLAKWLPLAAQFNAAPRFDALLRQTQQALAEAQDAQAAFVWPHAGRPEPTAGDFPACGFEFNEEPPARAVGALTFRLLRHDACVDRANLTLVCSAGVDALRAELRYDPAHFRPVDVERLAGQYATLVAGAASAPAAPAAELEMVGEAERQRLLVEWNETGAEYDTRVCIHHLFEAQAARTPDGVAVVYEEQQLTYAELDARSNQLAHYLRRAGVGPEVLVGVCVDRSPELIVGLLGVLKAGGAYVPLDPAYPRERRDYMQRDAGVAVLLTQQHLLEVIPPTDAQVLCLDAEWRRVAAEPTSSPAVAIGADNLAYVIYTSGSTGRPKGAMLHHRGIVNCLAWMQATYRLDQTDSFLLKTSLNFDPSVWEIFWPLAVGASVVVARPGGHRDPQYMARAIARHGVTSAYFVPSMLRAMLDEPALAECGALRRVICGGEALAVETMRRFYALLGAELHHSYGPTETSIAATEWTCAPDAPRVTMGRPLANTKLYVLAAGMRPVPTGVPGELYIGGVGVGRGYLGRAGLTAAAFIPDPFSTEPGARLYKTGDLVRYLSGGNVEFLGRVDDQVKIRGYRIELGEVEAVLARHPSIAEAVALAREDAPGQKRLVAYVVPAAGQAPALTELREHAALSLPDYMVPAAFVLLEAPPLLPSGKIDRRALPAPEQGAAAPDETYVAPRTPSEEVLAGLWEQVLGVARVGLNDNFFELGGHSLLATQLISRVRQTFQIELVLGELFSGPTVGQMAELIERELGAGRGTQDKPVERVARDGNPPLSFAQQRLWFLNRLDPESSFYNISFSPRLSGRLNVEALRRGFNEVYARHEALRTTFPVVEGEPVQLIAPPGEFELPLFDLSDLPESEREAQAHELVAANARQHFDLGAGPLMRALLVRLGPDMHVLGVTMHHIISDGWSIGVFVSELAAAYGAFDRGTRPDLPEPTLHYADYAAWQREQLQGEPLERLLAYWRTQLTGAPPALDLPTDRPRAAVQTYNGRGYSFNFSEGLLGRLHELSRREGVTLYMTLVAAFQLLLARYSGQTDVVVGTPIANRTRVETEGVIGCFVNTLALRTDLSGDITFRELLGRVRETTLGAYAHQDVPFEKLIEELRTVRDLARHPLFQVLFVMQNTPAPELDLPGLTLTSVEIETMSSQFDLALSLVEVGDSLGGIIEYNSDLFDRPTVVRLHGHLQTLLESAAADPDAKLDELPMLTEAERQKVLVEWNDTLTDYGTPVPLHELFERQAARTPDAAALVFEGQSLSYAELNRRSNRLARHLRSLGVAPDSLVGVLMERSPEMVVALLGTLKAGGAYVPLDPAYPRERLAFMLSDSQVSVLLTQPDLAARLPEVGAQVVSLDADGADLENYSDANLGMRLAPDNLAYMIYTSGSTGRPKGAMNTHGAITNRLLWMQREYGLTASDAVLQKTTFSFDVSVWEFFWPLLSGARLVVARPGGQHDPGYLAGLIESERVTVVHFVPSMLELFLAQAEAAECASLRLIICSGEALGAGLAARCQELLPAALHNLYGPTEAAVDVTYWACVRGAEARVIPIGRPVANTRMYVLDRHLKPVAVGVAGELYIGGVQLARGYLNRPALTAERFIPDPHAAEPGGRLYKTGDTARWTPEGQIEFLGRTDHQVKVRGYRIELGEVEAALKEHAAVREAAVVARAAGAGDTRLVAYVVPEDGAGAAPSAQELRAFLKEKLPEYMVPGAVMLLDAFPLTQSGKLDRRALPEPDGQRPELTTAYLAPQTEVQLAVAAVWRDVLKVERVGLHDNFFDLGGHSLLLIRVHNRLLEAFPQRALTIIDLFRYATVDALSKFLTEEATAEPALAQSQERGASRKASGRRQRELLQQRRGAARSAQEVTE